MTTTTTIFEQASREKTRFPYKGMCTAEDLWDLSVRELDGIFMILNADLRSEDTESLLGLKDNILSAINLQVAIIRHIVSVKLDEAAVAEQQTVRRQQKDRILTILADKRDAGLMAMSEDDLSKMLEDL